MHDETRRNKSYKFLKFINFFKAREATVKKIIHENGWKLKKAGKIERNVFSTVSLVIYYKEGKSFRDE